MNRLRSFMTTVTTYTALPADLIAILPVAYRILVVFNIAPNLQFETTPNAASGDFRIPLRDTSIVLLFYGCVANLYRINQLIKRHNDLRWADAISYLRQISITVTAVFGIPFILVLITFGVISLPDGLAIAAILAVLTYAFYSRWIFQEQPRRIIFRDLGLRYLLMLPLVWLCFEIDPGSKWTANLGWALLYTTIGYLASFLLAFMFREYFRRIRKLRTGVVDTEYEGGVALTIAILLSLFGCLALASAIFSWRTVLLMFAALLGLLFILLLRE